MNHWTLQHVTAWSSNMKICIGTNAHKVVIEIFTEAIFQYFLRNVIRYSNNQWMKSIYICLNYILFIVKIIFLAYCVWTWNKRIFFIEDSKDNRKNINNEEEEEEWEEEEREEEETQQIDSEIKQDIQIDNQRNEISEMQKEEMLCQEEKEALILNLVGKRL